MLQNYLQEISRKITKKLGLSLSKSNRDAQIAPVFDCQVDFLLQVLKATAHSGGNAKVIRSLLEANQEKLDTNFAQVLRSWATATLLDLDIESAQNTVIDIFNFSHELQDLPLGNRADNLAIAITGYEIALTVFTRDRFPEEWAMMQYNLGNAYLDCIQGEKEENLEQAISYYQQALEEYTCDRFPEEWAMMQHNLGNAYLDCIQGEKEENLEQAISCYQQALEEYTCDRFPYEWATTQNNLGLTYFYRIQGEKVENLEQAISCYQKALEEYTCDRFPYEWATTQNNLGLTYFCRIQGEKVENLEQAISCYQKALQEYTREAFPQDHAETAFNQGLAYINAKRFTDAYYIFKSAKKVVSGNEIQEKLSEECIEEELMNGTRDALSRCQNQSVGDSDPHFDPSTSSGQVLP